MTGIPCRCELCGELQADLNAALEHIRLLHPSVDAEPEFWSDGAVVVIDTTLEPEDFHE